MPYSNTNPIQLFDEASSTYTYIVFDADTRDAIIIDPVDAQSERDLAVIKKECLHARYILETHTHADHITSAAALIEHTGGQAATPAGCGIKASALQLQNGDVLKFGAQALTALHTPGHTAGSMCFVWGENVFTGDTLLIGGCGRIDFQSGSADALYNSIARVLFALPDDTVVWPGHDYKGNTNSSIGNEKLHNCRLTEQGQLRRKEDFNHMMNNLNLPRPKRMDEALPANLNLGVRHDASTFNNAADEAPRPVAAGAGYAGDVSPQLAFKWWQSGQAVLIDIRTNAERAWVGFIPDVPGIEWKMWPGMALNPEFDAQFKAAVPAGSKVLLLCRSGIRSIPAAQRAQALGYVAYNILEGFEGDPDYQAHRSSLGGWRKRGLPWKQN